ncbi:MAG: alpha-E domain-containing protein [Methylococcales bacterium]
MLSRSAERLYWLARYLERTENTARLISVTMNLIYDLPYGTEVGWHTLLTICNVDAAFNERFKIPSEQNISRFLLADPKNPSSLLSSLSYARENIRTSRELMPDEAWEQVNKMYLYATNNLDSLSNRRGRVIFLQKIMRGCQRFTGFIAGAMSRNDSYRFISLGRNIERADMTTRMIDFGTVLLAENPNPVMREYENTLWLNVLKSLSASLMYRKQVRQRIKGKEVLHFLLKNPDLPSSVDHCLQEISYSITKLPNSEALITLLNNLEQQMLSTNIAEITPTELHQILDNLQAEFNALHLKISETWFLNQLE